MLIAQVLWVTAPLLNEWQSWGGHDWDQMAGHRLLMVRSLLEYGQFPFWNPYGCGGHPSWSGVESGTAVVSPFFPIYLLFPIPVGLRLEVLGTALLSMAGTWLLAGRFTRSPAARAFVCAVFVVNGRFALQAAVGHTWHLYYAWLPWALFFFDRAWQATERRVTWREVTLGGVVIALMVYHGAVYPLPHAALALTVYGVAVALALRTWRPLAVGLAMGLAGAGLSAPKLLPMVDTLRRYPRLVSSTEIIDLQLLWAGLTLRDQSAGIRPVPVPAWGWHEYGAYIGWAACAGLLVGVIGARGLRERALKWLAAVLLVLSLGAFHEYAPWSLLHEYVPIFMSQHVPSRWLYPALLVFGLLTAAWAERWLARSSRRGWLELASLIVVSVIAADIALEAQGPLRGGFWMQMPSVTRHGQPYHQLRRAPRELRYRRDDYAPPSVPAILANVGVIECVSFPGLNVWAKNADGIIEGLGAIGRDEAGYRGEVYLESSRGEALLRRWTPNAVEIGLVGLTAPDRLVLNQNYDPGWSADGAPTESWQDKVSVRVAPGRASVTFRYRPPLWTASLLVFAATVGLLLAVRRRFR